MEQVYDSVAQGHHDSGCMFGAYLEVVLAERHIGRVVQTCFRSPMTLNPCGKSARGRAGWIGEGDQVDPPRRSFPGHGHRTADLGELGRAG